MKKISSENIIFQVAKHLRLLLIYRISIVVVVEVINESDLAQMINLILLVMEIGPASRKIAEKITLRFGQIVIVAVLLVHQDQKI